MVCISQRVSKHTDTRSYDKARSKVLMFDAAIGNTTLVKTGILEAVTKSLAVTAATIYEAEIAACRSFGSLQKDKVLATAAQNFAVRSDGASAADFVHPLLLEIAVASADGVMKRAAKKPVEKKGAASSAAASSAS
jgi:hypothetical protein